MQDHQLYAQILGVSAPWHVARVELHLTEGSIDVFLEHAPGVQFACSKCGKPSALYDHQPSRSWRHLDTCQYRTLVHTEPPRTTCPIDGVLTVRLPWAEPNSRFTALFEALAIDWLKVSSQAAVARNLHLSWDEMHLIQEHAVQRGLARRNIEIIDRLAIDETAARRGHRYLTVVNDGEKVLFVDVDRTKASLDGFWATLSQEQLDGIQAISMDMWEPYLNSIRANVPDADKKIVFDKFHIAKHLNESIDRVRRQEHRALRAAGDRRLVGTKHDWLRNQQSFSADAWRAFGPLRASTLKTARAWGIKELFMEFFAYRYEKPARAFFRRWYHWATHSRLVPVIKIAKMLKGRFENIITYLKRPITNAIAESLNAKIQWAKYTARGFRNTANLITAIFFHCGGLDLKPRPT
jgi:transposase